MSVSVTANRDFLLGEWMIQVRRRRKLWLRSGLGLQFDGNAMLNARNYTEISLSDLIRA